MNKNLILNLFVALAICLGISFAAEAPNAGFVRVSRDAYPIEKNKVEIANMPKFRDQGKVGMCSAFSAAAALDYCYMVTNNLKSSEVGDDQRFSTLELHSFVMGTSNPDIFYGDAHTIIHQALKNGLLANEASAPMDLVHKRIKVRSFDELKKMSSKETLEKVKSKFEVIPNADPMKSLVEASQEVAWLEFERTWNLYKKIDRSDTAQLKPFVSSRVTGEFGVIASFNLTNTSDEVLNALGKKSFEECLAALFLPPDAPFVGISLPIDLRLELYPPEGKTSTYAETIKIVRQRIEESIPIIVSNYCVDDKSIKAMNDRMHDFLITGYKEVHNNKGYRSLVKIHNSWGAEWQDREDNDGGWMDAESLFNRTLYRSQSLGWITMPDRYKVPPIDKEPIVFNIPENWKLAKGKIPKTPKALAYMLSSPAARNAQCSISIENSEMNSADTEKLLKKLLSDDCKPYLSPPDSLSKLEFKEIKLKEGLGLYMNFIDPDMIGKHVKIGSYKTVTPIVLSMGSKYLVRATIFCDDISGEDYMKIMKMIETMSLKK
jgi:hypothetical protein